MALNFPFLATLSNEARTALEIVQRVKETGETIGRASWHLTGKTWNAARLQTGLKTVTSAMSELGVASAEADALVAEGLQLTTAAAEVTAGTGGAVGLFSTIGSWLGLSGTAATVAGVLVVTAVLGGVTYGAATYLGSKAGDKPVQAGPAASGEHTRKVDAPPESPGKSPDPYGVFVGGGYNEVIVGQLPVILEARSSSLIGWGNDSSKKVKDTGAKFTMVLGPFKTAEEARKAYEANKVPGSQRIKPLATGTCARFTFDGKEHDIDNALRMLR